MVYGRRSYKLAKKENGSIKGFAIKMATCVPKEQAQILIDYFREVWNIHFYTFHEGKQEDSFSLACGTREGKKFIEIVKPYVEQIPTMRYKIEYDKSRYENNV